MSPGQLSPQRGDNRWVGERLSEADHVPQALLVEAAPVLGRQFPSRLEDDPRPIGGAALLEYLAVDADAYLPVQGNERRVRDDGDLLASRLDHRSDVAHERRHVDLGRHLRLGWPDDRAGLSPRCGDLLRARLAQLPRRAHGPSSSSAARADGVARASKFSMRRLSNRSSSLACESFRIRVGGSRRGSGGGVVVVRIT